MRYVLLIIIVLVAQAIAAQATLSPSEVVDAQLEAYNARDIEAFAQLYAEHIEAFEYGSEQPFIVGMAALKRAYGAIFQTSPNLNAYSAHRIVQGSKVIDQEIADGMNGREAVQVTVIYEVANGLIEKVIFIY